jgi:hypothetical protein
MFVTPSDVLPAARVDAAGVILCDVCDRPASTVHLLPDAWNPAHAKAACSRHTLGGHQIDVSGLENSRTLLALLFDLADKGGRKCPTVLLCFLEPLQARFGA